MILNSLKLTQNDKNSRLRVSRYQSLKEDVSKTYDYFLKYETE